MTTNAMRWTVEFADGSAKAFTWRGITDSREETLSRSTEAASIAKAIAGQDASALTISTIAETGWEHNANVDWIAAGELADGLRAALPSRTISDTQARAALNALLCADPLPTGEEANPHLMTLATSDKGLSVGSDAFHSPGTLRPVAMLEVTRATSDAMTAIMMAHACWLNLSSEHKLLTVGPGHLGSATLRAAMLARYRSRSREGMTETLALLRRIGAGPIADRLEAAMDGQG